jgi:hypothetical protein
MGKDDKVSRILRVRLVASNPEALAEVLKLGPFDWGGRGPRTGPQGRLGGEVYVSPQKLEELKKIAQCEVELIEDATEVGRKRQQEVGKGDRFEGGKKAPRGLGKKG